jgi:hypothetical protein
MKKIFVLFACLSIAALSASAQTVIKANNAKNHIGEQVSIVDNVYHVTVYNDSTAVVDMGGKNKKATLNVVFNFDSNFKFDAAMMKSLKKSKIAINGFVVLVDGQPAIVLTDKQNLKFVSKPAEQKWAAKYQRMVESYLASR